MKHHIHGNVAGPSHFATLFAVRYPFAEIIDRFLRVGVVDSVGRNLLSIWTRPFGHFSHLTNRGILAAARDPEFSRLFRSQLEFLTRTNSAATYVAHRAGGWSHLCAAGPAWLRVKCVRTGCDPTFTPNCCVGCGVHESRSRAYLAQACSNEASEVK